MDNKVIDILLVEDNPGDADLTREALRESRIQNQIHLAGDGDEAMEFLFRRGRHAGKPRPDLVLLDLNLPGKNGFEVLSEIKQDADLRRIPIVVLTSSQADQDIYRCYNSHANCYVTKPSGLDAFLAAVRRIEDFWLGLVKLSTV